MLNTFKTLYFSPHVLCFNWHSLHLYFIHPLITGFKNSTTPSVFYPSYLLCKWLLHYAYYFFVFQWDFYLGMCSYYQLVLFFLTYWIPFNISCKAVLVVKNSFSFASLETSSFLLWFWMIASFREFLVSKFFLQHYSYILPFPSDL